MLKSFIVGVITSFISAVAAISLFALICTSFDDPGAYVDLFGIGAYLLGGACGAFVAALMYRENMLASSVSVSVFYAVTVFLICVSDRDDTSRPLVQSVLLSLVVPVISTVLCIVASTRSAGTAGAKRRLRKRITKR